MNVYVFVGPTISAGEVREAFDVECLPPASQGDVYRAALHRPQIIGIIDGYFERVPSVWHKEILWAMAQGIHVFGSASMGALRAAELGPFGMEGVGKIFAAYADGTLEDDDEVAVLHAPAEFGYRPLSEAMVSIRATVAAGQAAGAISESAAPALIRLAKDFYYADRTYPRILERASAEFPGATEEFRRWLPAGRIDQKREDAIDMLRCIRNRLSAGIAPKRVQFTLEGTKYWNSAMRETQVPSESESPDSDLRPLLRRLLGDSRPL